MTNIDIIILPVTDQPKAKQFYRQLGFEVIVEAPADQGQTWIQLALPGQPVSIALMPFSGIIIETPDIEQERQTLRKSGIAVGDIDDQPWGRFAWFKDPDGNGLCLRQKPVA